MKTKDALVQSIESAMSQFNIPADQVESVFDDTMSHLMDECDGDPTADAFDYLADSGYSENARK